MTKIRNYSLSILAIAIFFVFAVASGSDDKKTSDNSSTTETKKESLPTIGQELQTDYFLVTLNKVETKNKVSTGNEFADLKAEQGNKYLIINVTFKNTDKESRMLMEGTVYIDYNGTRYEFDKSETLLVEGWGLMLDQINPLTSKTTNLVYKIPAEITGEAYWNPGRSDKDQMFYLGTVGTTAK